MRSRSWLTLVLLVGAAATASGCLGDSGITGSGARAGGVTITDGGGSGALERAFDGPESVPVEIDGAPGRAIVALVRETAYPGGAGADWRHPCGGALLGAPPDAGDPRIALPTLEHVRAHRVVDADGTAWTVDRYARAGAAHGDLASSVWVVNLGGGEEFREDDGEARCAVEGDAPEAYNALLVAPGLDALEIWFSPRQRPAPPETDPADPARTADPASPTGPADPAPTPAGPGPS